MPLKVALLFHFNQDLHETASLASKAGYFGLLKVLLASQVRANIHISGTLIQALSWLDPGPLDLIREGLRKGQFELVGSAHAQNILYASDDWDNAAQIALHRRILEETFQARPVAFWNPERCWRQSLGELIFAAGYRVLTVETPILAASGASAPILYETGPPDRALRIVPDDETFKHLFNFGAWFGDPKPACTYLNNLLAGEGPQERVIAYAEDAEAMGLWGYPKGIDPRQTWARLAVLLEEIARLPDVETVHFRSLGDPSQRIETIKDGSAAWMDASLQVPGRPYHESGYRDWFDYIARSPKVAYFREFFAGIRQALQDAKPHAQPALYELALHAYLTHQYEFACIGIGAEDARIWRGAAAALPLLAAADPVCPGGYGDVNADSIEELVLCTDPYRAVLTPIGGRLLYLVDAASGRLIVGTPSSVLSGKYRGDSSPPEPAEIPEPVLPENLDLISREISEAAPTRMAPFLPDWVWDTAAPMQTLAVFDQPPEREMRFALSAQQGAFADEIRLNGQCVFSKTDRMVAEPHGFTLKLEGGIFMTKEFSIVNDGIRCLYRFLSPVSAVFSMTTSFEVPGDYAAILRKGRAAVRHLQDQSPAEIEIVPDRTRVVLRSQPEPVEIRRGEALLALTLEARFEIRLEAGRAHEIQIGLGLKSG